MTHSVDDSELAVNKPASTISSSENHLVSEAVDVDAKVGLNTRALRRFKIAYAVSSFGFSPAFAGMITYGLFQLQAIGFTIGHVPGAPPGSSCPPGAPSCRVPWAGKGDVNLTSFILYLNAISYAVSGLLTLFISAIGDYVKFKREQYVFFLIVYGALCLPFAALTKFDLGTFNTIAALYSVFNITGFMIQAWMKMFIPYTMQATLVDNDRAKVGQKVDQPVVADATVNVESKRMAREKTGVQMGLWSSNAMNASTVLFYLIYIGVSYASFTAQSQAGLWITTGAGVVCIVFTLISWRFLPNPSKKSNSEINWFKLPFMAFAELWQGVQKYPEAFKFLIAYTIYNDSNFAFGSVISQLFMLIIRPSAREFTAYSITSPLASILFLTLWYYFRRHVKRLSLRHWTIIGYTTMAFVSFWCLLGLSSTSKIGFKHRWEFYFMAIFQGFSNAITSTCFTVLFCQLFPKGSEIQYFGFQLVLSCCTVWIPQVVDGPIVDATNNVRLPAIISFVFFLISTGLASWTNEEKGIQHVRQVETEQESL